jgi:hypothetical protein
MPGVAKRILQYLDSIDKASGRAKKMDFLRIAGNEANANQWIEYLCSCNLISEQIDAPVRGDDNGGSRKYYVKTELGQKVHEVLKSHEHLGSLLDDLSRMKRRRS